MSQYRYTPVSTGFFSFSEPLVPILSTADNTTESHVLQVAAGEVDLAIGSDQGGSVRMPACWCGLVGLKPTFGLVPYTGAAPLEPTIDHLGPIARTVKDCALLLEVNITDVMTWFWTMSI